MLSKQEMELLNEFNYNLVERRNINKYIQVRVYTSNSKENIISIYSSKLNTSILLYNTTIKDISKYIVSIDSKKKIKNKRKKI
jgi:hypothetical protein